MTGRYIRASELRSFSFCRRAWLLEQQGRTSMLQAERNRGEADHRRHGDAVISATAAARLSSALVVLSVAVLVIAALFWWHWR